MASPSQTSPIRIGLIGCGEIAQVAHIPTINFLSTKFTLTYLCDINPKALAFCASRCSSASPPKTTQDAKELCASENVDAVLVCSSDAYHVVHGVYALKNGKHVFIEKPLALCQFDIQILKKVESTSKGRVFVGYMRRYASAFLDAVKELGGTEGVQYVKVRDIICPNSIFINQSGTFPQKFDGISEEEKQAFSEREDQVTHEALVVDMGLAITEKRKTMLRLLGGLGSHDLSAMRELLGMPRGVLGARLSPTMWTVLFDYPNFAVTYESGFNNIPLFDASIEIFTEDKVVTVKYDTPYVKGLPTTIVVREKAGDGTAYQERVLRTSYEDPYTKQMGEWWECIVNGKEPKTTIDDAALELDLFKMILRAAD
ncbi:hypothetical protein AOL_s00080g100 [Orbilia oligospora ATCC 24927]|uniref:Gfo/Idh/MocA-like oxidoreductase N-terminal domain-containing protein n=1 Tax=Arthrobotrys oligospora (strain ATCC 24927 / CBS 115.81 / DSM 1491) TaxID=756982 RepID=G1XE65_ARTOA|nr:hypothetical protein AOL_s00080g100 [Orbilia oligospora ATCC 24927]EGX48471.1 hypothetical protein AOL_s00080g100 [Orbilia oligospora ATCC 24927]